MLALTNVGSMKEKYKICILEIHLEIVFMTVGCFTFIELYLNTQKKCHVARLVNLKVLLLLIHVM